MQLSHFWVAAIAVAAGLFLSGLLRGGHKTETVYPEASQQGLVARVGSDLDGARAECRAEFARFERDHELRTRDAASAVISTPAARQLQAELRAAADSVIARMHEVERYLDTVVVGDHGDAARARFHEAAAKFHDAREFYDGLAQRWDSLSRALQPK
jgi:hypothetical protein